MRRLLKFSSVFMAVLLLMSTILAFFVTTPTSAVGCYKQGCNGKDPVLTGCNQNGYLAAQYMFERPESGIPIFPDTPYLQLYYSLSCGTNWLRITHNPFGGDARKFISLGSTGGFMHEEIDRGYGSSYSMQVYAPGSTKIVFSGTLRDRSGVRRAIVQLTPLW